MYHILASAMAFSFAIVVKIVIAVAGFQRQL
jgi:hypothetical protein